jgi:ribonucleoside-diphosphate reductase alpha chain
MNEHKFTRKWVLSGYTYHIPSGCGTAHITVNFQDGIPVEIYSKASAAGGCQANMEAIGRIISASLQSGVPCNIILDQLDSVRCPTAMAKKDKTHFLVAGDDRQYFIRSCPHAIATAIRMAIEQHSKDNKTNDLQESEKK